jgi:hypothetical protein
MGYRYVRAKMPALLAIALVSSLASLAISACAGSGPGSSASPTTLAATTSSETIATDDTATTAGAGPSTTGAVVLADGRYPAYVKKVDLASRAVVVDVIQFFTGAAAAKAATEDKQESPPPNDYYIRNSSKRLRTLPVAPTARITVNVLGSDETGDATKDLPVDLPKLASYFPTQISLLFWVTVQHDEVEDLQEQFLP